MIRANVSKYIFTTLSNVLFIFNHKYIITRNTFVFVCTDCYFEFELSR